MDQAHRQSLETKHSGLEARIQEEERRRHPDELEIAKLKKEKLRLKDAMENG